VFSKSLSLSTHPLPIRIFSYSPVTIALLSLTIWTGAVAGIKRLSSSCIFSNHRSRLVCWLAPSYSCCKYTYTSLSYGLLVGLRVRLSTKSPQTELYRCLLVSSNRAALNFTQPLLLWIAFLERSATLRCGMLGTLLVVAPELLS